VDEELDPSGALAEVQEVWESQARADPLWAVLSEPERAGRRWQVSEFLATGEEHVARTLARYEELGGELPDRELALDFGSGVGRLTQPLARRFDKVIGVDISPTMAAVAERLNRYGDRVTYRVNDQPDLSFVADRSVSLVSTHITLQHIPSRVAELYLREFLRVIKPGGGIVFQLPSHYADSYLPADRDDQPVPSEARRATLELLTPLAPAEAGSVVDLSVAVTNRSGTEWLQSAPFPLRVGNRWRDETGDRVLHDEGRSRLPGRIRPGETAEVEMQVHMPPVSGHFRLELDVVQELVAWFEDFGSTIVSVPLEVVSGAPPEVSTSAPTVDVDYAGGTFHDLIAAQAFEAPMFEMNPIPRAAVEQLLRSAGATLLGADEWVNEWHSFTYYVRAAHEEADTRSARANA
jgi:SAM-dependent methyltransferase